MISTPYADSKSNTLAVQEFYNFDPPVFFSLEVVMVAL